MGNKIKPLTLIIDKDLWEKYKSTIPREITLNDSVVYLINAYLNNKEVNQNGE